MSNNQTKLAMALHCHQPVGNFPNVFEQITEESYRPFLERFHAHENTGSIGFHASGILLEWWSKHDPEMIDLIGDLVDEDRCHLITAGYYEPILSLIPRDDRRYQVEKHLDILDTLFGVRPDGLWLTERIWQPDLPEDLAPLGIDYTVVDDFHFNCAGWDRDKLSGYYTTESNGQTMDIFPISQDLRYRIPFYEVDEIVSYMAEASGHVLTMADDGEKFGSWPDTRKWVYEDGWLDRFFEACSENRINLRSLDEAHEAEESSGQCYLPTASYQEMLEWALPADAQTAFREWKNDHPDQAEEHGRGGFFQHFLVKYPESNRLHKRMQWLSGRIDKDDNPKARETLLGGQCNDSYWHGVFGGLFLPHLRSSVWNQLCQAYEAGNCTTDEPLLRDYDRDGRTEVIYGDDSQFFVMDPMNGGELTSWELYPPGRNVLDTLTRRWESYLTRESAQSDEGDGEVDTIHHKQTEVPSEWLERWAPDPYARAGLQLIGLTSPETSPGDVRLNEDVRYLLRETPPSSSRIEDGTVRLGYENDVKQIKVTPGNKRFEWTGSIYPEELNRWGTMSTLGFRSSLKEDAHLFIRSETYSVTDELDTDARSISCVDNLAGFQLDIEFQDSVRLLTYPIETISRSEEEAEKIYQGTALLFITDQAELRLESSWSSVDAQ